MVQIAVDENQAEELHCGDCGAPMKLRKAFDGKLFFGCTKYPECYGTHSAHQETGMPMGIPADKETRQWRMKAHDAFDEFWQKRRMHRVRAYTMLAYAMGLSVDKTHISMFTKEQCQQVIKVCQEGLVRKDDNKTKNSS